MKIHQTPIAGLILAESAPRIDERGSFTRLYCENELGEIVGARKIAQINNRPHEPSGLSVVCITSMSRMLK